jgi:hypothetical protein
MFSFLAGTTTAAIAVLILLPTKWNVILRKEVKEEQENWKNHMMK